MYIGLIPKPTLSPGIRETEPAPVCAASSCGVLIIAAALIFPFLGSRSQIDFRTTLVLNLCDVGFRPENIVVGLAGLLDLGYVGFYAVGAYTYAMLAQFILVSAFWTGLVAAGIMAAFFGFILGFPVLRLRGDYLAIVTLGFGEIIRILLNNLTDLTGGPRGIGSIPKPTFFNLEFSRRASEGSQTFHEFFGIAFNSNHRVMFLYLLALLLVLITVFCYQSFNSHAHWPAAWEAMREDEIACRALGMNPTNIKLSAFYHWVPPLRVLPVVSLLHAKALSALNPLPLLNRRLF